MKTGGEVYLYDGYIHAKTITVDEKACSIGTTNFDQRSLSLNDEINAFIYHQGFAKKYKMLFEENIRNSIRFTEEDYESKNILIRTRKLAMESTLRLITPFL